MTHGPNPSGSGFNPTRPRADRIRFVSDYTGEHVLDQYLEHAERGSRTLGDLLSDLFDTSGNFNADLFEFRQSSGSVQIRVGTYSPGQSEEGWSTLSPTLRAAGSFITQTTYNQLELVGLGSKLYIVNTDGQSYPSAADFEAASTTDLLFDAATFGDASEAIALQAATDAQASAALALDSLNQTNVAITTFQDPTTGSLTLAQAAAASATTTKSQIDTIYGDIQSIQGNINSNLTQTNTLVSTVTNLANQSNTDVATLNAIATQQTTDIANVTSVANQNSLTLASITTEQVTLASTAASIAATQSNLDTAQAQVTTDAAAATAVLQNSDFIAVSNALNTSIATVSTNIAAINTLNTSFSSITSSGTSVSTFASDITALGPIATDIELVSDNIDNVIAAAQAADVGSALEGALVIGPLILL